MYYIKRHGVYKHDLIYKGWLVMIFKAGTPTVSINFFPAINLEELKKLESTNKALYDQINSVCARSFSNITMPSPGDIKIDFIIDRAKSHIDYQLGEFNLNAKLQSI